MKNKVKNILLVLLASLSVIIIGLVLFIGFGLGDRFESKKLKEVNHQHEKAQRHLKVSQFDSTTHNYEIVLNIETRDSVIIYKYNNLSDSDKSLEFRFLDQKDLIMTGPMKLENINEIRKFNNLNFDKYQATATDGLGPLYFNKKYGVLFFDNGWGMQFYFSDNEKFFSTDSIDF